MRQAGDQPPAFLLHPQQPTGLQDFDVDRRVDHLQELDLQGLPESHHAERAADRVVQVAQSSLDDLDEPGRRREWSAEPPDLFLTTKHAGLEGAQDDFPEEQGVALRPPMEQVQGGSVDRPAQRRGK